MRRALWLFSAPVVAGGLAWAVNAADNQTPLLARAPQAQNGQIFYFSRGGKSGSATSATEADTEDTTSNDSDAADTPPVAQRYVRKRPAAVSASKPGVKNYYQDLFADDQSPTDKNRDRATADDTVAVTSAASRSVKPAASAVKVSRQPVVEECGVNDASDLDQAREDLPLPAAGKTTLVGGTRPQSGVRHAEHLAQEGSKRKVEQVQYNARPAAGKGRPSPGTGSAVAAPADDDTDTAAPVPPPMTKPVRTTKVVKPGKPPATKDPRPTVALKPTQNAAPKVARKPLPASKILPVAATEEDTRDAVIPAAVADAVTSDAGAGDVPMVSLRWTKKDEVNVGQECKCGLVVKNTGKLAAKDIVVEAFFPRTVKLLDAEPFPSDTKDHLIWIFDHLEPGQEKTIEITMIPGRRGELATSATVRFTGVASAILTVEEPQLSLSISGANEGMVGESLTQVITISNSGTGIAHDVVVHAKIPQGLEHSRGKRVEMGIGSLAAGESRELKLPLAAISGGDAVIVVEAHGSSNLSQKAETTIKVAAPKLSVEISGPGLRYIGRHAQYIATVTNDGIAATDNVRIVDLIPEGFEFIKADKGGKFDASSGSVSWFVGRVEAGQSIQVAVDLNAKQSGEFLHHVQASGENGTIATAKTATRVDGSAAVVMEVTDLDDPVEVGTQTAYEIRIRNTGSKSAQNLRIACELPDGVELIDTKGPTDSVMEKGVLTFKPVGELAVGAKMTYLIRVNGRVAGNLRLRAMLTSNGSTEPLVVEEVTKFYAD